MTRALPSTLLTAVAADTGERVQLIQLQFASATLYLTTAAQDINWGGATWEGVGGHIGAEGMRETTNAEAPGCRLMLSGIDQSIVAVILADAYRGRRATIYEAHLDPTTGLVIDDPMVVFDGYMNEGFAITDRRDASGGGTVDLETRLTDKISDLIQRRGVRTNVHSHQHEIPGATTDTFFQHVASLQGKKFYWGSVMPMSAADAKRAYEEKFGHPYRPSSPMDGAPGAPTHTPWGSPGPTGGYAPGS